MIKYKVIEHISVNIFVFTVMSHFLFFASISLIFQIAVHLVDLLLVDLLADVTLELHSWS